jgi:hypothetical protein
MSYDYVYIVIESGDEFGVISDKIIGAYLSKDRAYDACIDKSKHRHIKTVPILDKQIKPKYDPIIVTDPYPKMPNIDVGDPLKKKPTPFKPFDPKLSGL